MDLPSTANPWLDLLGKGVAVVAAGWALYRRWATRQQRRQREMEARIVATIQASTKPIQPGSNGSLSMPDLHKKVDVLMDRQTIIQQTLLDHLSAHDSRNKE